MDNKEKKRLEAKLQKMEQMLEKCKAIFVDAGLKNTEEEAQIEELQKMIDELRNKVDIEEETENTPTVDKGRGSILDKIGQALAEMEAKFGIK